MTLLDPAARSEKPCPLCDAPPGHAHSSSCPRHPSDPMQVRIPAARVEPLSDERILHLWDTRVAYQSGDSLALKDADKLSFARAVLAAARLEPIPGGVARPDSRTTLLKAAYDLLRKQEKSFYVLNVLEQTAFYDGSDCDGYCLMQDIADELDLDADGSLPSSTPGLDPKGLRNTIHEALASFQCQHTTVEGDGDGMPLLDMLTPKGGESVGRGFDELNALADHIAGALTDDMSGLDPIRSRDGEVNQPVKWDGYTADEWALRNATLERAAQMCEQRACSSRDTGSPSGMARQCAADIRSLQRGRPSASATSKEEQQ